MVCSDYSAYLASNLAKWAAAARATVTIAVQSTDFAGPEVEARKDSCGRPFFVVLDVFLRPMGNVLRELCLALCIELERAGQQAMSSEKPFEVRVDDRDWPTKPEQCDHGRGLLTYHGSKGPDGSLVREIVPGRTSDVADKLSHPG